MKIKRVWLTDCAVWVEDDKGRQAYELFASYPPLMNATAEQRNDYELSSIGIHWRALDEDLSFAGFFAKKPVTL